MAAESGHDSSHSVLRVSNLTSGYRRVAIVQDISFSVGKGEILAVVGRNGVGKTTLMKGAHRLAPDLRRHHRVQGRGQ